MLWGGEKKLHSYEYLLTTHSVTADTFFFFFFFFSFGNIFNIFFFFSLSGLGGGKSLNTQG